MFAWFDATEAKAFGTSLAQFFIQQLPLDQQVNEKKFAAKTQYSLKRTTQRVDEFRKSARLNTYKRAQLANAFGWTLKDAGYDPKYVQTLSTWLVARLG